MEGGYGRGVWEGGYGRWLGKREGCVLLSSAVHLMESLPSW